MLSWGTSFNKKLMVHRDGSLYMVEKVEGICKQLEDNDFVVVSKVEKYATQIDMQELDVSFFNIALGL